MRCLVDTHYLIWSLLDPARIEATKKEVLLDPSATKHVSKITYWEIALKYSLGKLVLKGISPEQLLERSWRKPGSRCCTLLFSRGGGGAVEKGGQWPV